MNCYNNPVLVIKEQIQEGVNTCVDLTESRQINNEIRGECDVTTSFTG